MRVKGATRAQSLHPCVSLWPSQTFEWAGKLKTHIPSLLKHIGVVVDGPSINEGIVV